MENDWSWKKSWNLDIFGNIGEYKHVCSASVVYVFVNIKNIVCFYNLLNLIKFY